jgi:hypothetical protein
VAWRSSSLPTSESWKEKATRREKTATEWHNIVAKNEARDGIVEK